ncbi:MAG: peroxiredoxin-like family protein [Saprospiraceae bacterium]|nr:peroxiredoxin-like family protein [Saprospiraceae bacterium]
MAWPNITRCLLGISLIMLMGVHGLVGQSWTDAEAAAGVLPKAKEAGEAISDFSAVSADGKRIRLSELLDKGPVVVVFYRGFWHEPCLAHLRVLQDSLNVLAGSGLQLIAISPEQPESLVRTRQRTQTVFPLLSDTGGAIMDVFGVGYKVSTAYRQHVYASTGVNIALNNGSEEAFLALASTFVISHNQEVFWRQVSDDPAHRTGVGTILRAIRPRY